MLPSFIFKVLPLLMVVVVKICVLLFFVTLQVIVFESSLSGMSGVESYVLKTWRAHASNNS
jgi:hypothetical protein